MLFRKKKTLVFGRASLKLLPKHWISEIEIFPPLAREELAGILKEYDPHRTAVLILDGLFGNSMSVTVTECRHAIKRGFLLYGASSMGALRAADLWPCGMIGIGDIYMMLRTSKISDDSEVAVRYDEFLEQEITVSGVHFRSVIQRLIDARKIPQIDARRIMSLGLSIPWFDRIPEVLDSRISRDGSEEIALDIKRLLSDPKTNPKLTDALAAIRIVKANAWPGYVETTI